MKHYFLAALKPYLKIPTMAIGLITSGLLIGMAGVYIGGIFTTPLVIIGIILAAIGAAIPRY